MGSPSRERRSENTIAGHNWIVNNTYGVMLSDDGTMNNILSANLIADSDFNGVYVVNGAKANTIGPENMIRSNNLDGVLIGGADTYRQRGDIERHWGKRGCWHQPDRTAPTTTSSRR